MAEGFDHKKYRVEKAKELRETKRKTTRRRKLDLARSTQEYGRAFGMHTEEKRREAREKGKRRWELPLDRLALYERMEQQIGNTPLVELVGKLPNANRLFVKQEFKNGIGHSHYDRVYIELFKEKERLRIIEPGMNVFETTSGTAGVSFAAIGRELGFSCHVAIPGGGEHARVHALLNEGATVYLTSAEAYVNGFPDFIKNFSQQHPGYVFLNHSMGNVLGKGLGYVNEKAVGTMHQIADEITMQLKAQGAENPIVLSALGNGTNTLGLAQRFQAEGTESHTPVIAYESLSSAVAYKKKYGEQAYHQLVPENTKFTRQDAPGTSFPGIDFPALNASVNRVDKVLLFASQLAEKEYKKQTHKDLPSDVVKTTWNLQDPDLKLYGRSTLAGVSVAQHLATKEPEKRRSFIVIGYDTFDRYDRDGDLEPLSEKSVAVFGAQGNLGTNLCDRLQHIKPGRMGVVATVAKDLNKEAALESDLVILTVRPDQIESLLAEISRPSATSPAPLKQSGQVLSFAAHYPIVSRSEIKGISEITGRPAARGMTDPYWNISAFVIGEGFSEENYGFLFDGLTRTKPLRFKDDVAIDRFTVLISHLFTILLLKKIRGIKDANENLKSIANLLNVDAHLHFVSSELGISTEEFEKYETGNDPEISLKTIATRGGVVERIVETLRQSPDIQPADLFSLALSSEE